MASEATRPSTTPDRGVVLEENAFLWIVLHALKYPLSGVNGVLVGTRVKSTDNTSTSTVISRVAPMIHTNTSLPGQLEIAVALLDERLKELNRELKEGEQGTAKLEVVGYYQCNERRDDLELGPVARRIADGIGTLALVLDADALRGVQDGTGKKPPFVLFKKGAGAKGSWIKADSREGVQIPCLGSTSWVERLREAISGQDFGGVHDFEEHMEDVRIDFLH